MKKDMKVAIKSVETMRKHGIKCSDPFAVFAANGDYNGTKYIIENDYYEIIFNGKTGHCGLSADSFFVWDNDEE